MKWIPVTERLPECKLDCILHSLLVTVDNDDPNDDPETLEAEFWCSDGKFHYIGMPDTYDGYWKVTAWMELPKPFKKGD